MRQGEAVQQGYRPSTMCVDDCFGVLDRQLALLMCIVLRKLSNISRRPVPGELLVYGTIPGVSRSC